MTFRKVDDKLGLTNQVIYVYAYLLEYIGENVKFAIIEDNKRDAAVLMEHIEKYCITRHIDFELSVFHSENDLWSAFRSGMFDIVFMDIFLEHRGAQGISLGEKLQKEDKNLSLVFYTSSPDYYAESNKMNAVHYLQKPVTEESFANALYKLTAFMERDARYITVTINYKKTDIFLKDIVYAEVYGNNTIIHLTEGQPLTTRRALSVFETDLRKSGEGFGDSFIRCHKGYLVNMNHVLEADDDGDFIMSNGHKVYVRVKKGGTGHNILHNYVTALARQVS